MKKALQNIENLRFLTVFLVCLTVFVSVLNSGFAQMTVVGGTTVKVETATTLNSTQNVVLGYDPITLVGGTLNVQGTLVLKKNLVNQNITPNSLGNGAIVLSGTVPQTVSGQSIIQDLAVNNPAGVTIAGNTQINGVFTLTNGLVSLGAYNLQLGPAATVSGVPSSSKMVVATGTGELRKEFASVGSFTFPVGALDVPTDEYAPVTISYNTGTFGAGNYTGVNLVDEAYSGTAISYLTMYWNVTQSGVTNFTGNASFQYNNPGDVVGTEGDIYCTKVSQTVPWITYNGANTGTHKIDAHGLTSFGSFTGNLGNGSIPPGIRSLQDKTITGAPVTCADATQTLIISGNGTYYHVLVDGSATHIAGQNIIYYPGTKVDLGGYLHGKISTIFCSPPNPILAPVIAGNINQGVQDMMDNGFFKIYPNPTPGKFTLELKGDQTESDVHIEIFGILGDRILSKDMKLERKQEFSLSDKPVGVYVIHVTSGLNTQTEKIIKR
ncbi:MAG: T9SS type A sorting domain-containing protein [Bacteroidetes bacterium]|nr:T9SS type A sorting domain-containing protein [Bacteroidota bacterium]